MPGPKRELVGRPGRRFLKLWAAYFQKFHSKTSTFLENHEMVFGILEILEMVLGILEMVLGILGMFFELFEMAGCVFEGGWEFLRKCSG